MTLTNCGKFSAYWRNGSAARSAVSMNERRDVTRLAVVAPFYNESARVFPFLERLTAVLTEMDVAWTVLCVNDGSADDTLARLVAAHEREPRIKVIDLSRNFGKEFALTAGLDHCTADAVVVMDSDLQHPPEILPAMFAKWHEGYEVVYMIRQARGGVGFLASLGRRVFYLLFRLTSKIKLPPEAGDFRLLDASVVAAIRCLPECTRFMKGIFHWVGFRQIGLPYKEAIRENGNSRWGFWRLSALAIDGITAFSNLPLRIWGALGATIASISLAYGLFRVIRYFTHGADVPGFESIIVAVVFLGGIQLLCLGVLGGYISRIFDEVKRRPLYIVRQTYGIDGSNQQGVTALRAEWNNLKR
jgi:polyisoprenyl-phosphate glycosyltransferase